MDKQVGMDGLGEGEPRTGSLFGLDGFHTCPTRRSLMDYPGDNPSCPIV